MSEQHVLSPISRWTAVRRRDRKASIMAGYLRALFRAVTVGTIVVALVVYHGFVPPSGDRVLAAVMKLADRNAESARTRSGR